MLAIIVARAGSKRLPKKNIKKLKGKPLVEYSIEQAVDSHYINTVIISTDFNEIKDIVNKHKNDIIPIIYDRRPKHLRGDDVTSQAVIDDIIRRYPRKGYVLLQPTSPLRTSEDIDKCIKMFYNNDVDSVISVVETSLGKYKNNGAVFVFKNKIHSYNKLLYVMPKEKSINIDKQEDWNEVERMLDG